MNVDDDKHAVRQYVAELKNRYDAATLQKLSSAIITRLEQSPLFITADTVACYCALPTEVQTEALIAKWNKTKTLLLPATDEGKLRWYAYHSDIKMTKSQLRITEPVPEGEEIPSCEIDLVIVPGIAFDRRLNRLGRGKGYYDRFLASFDKPVVGLCFGFQLFDTIPADIHDIKMTQIITENEVIRADS